MAPLLVADLFCGAGGTSSGARRALGARMDLVAVNHWATAIETHARNHPKARHLCSNVYQLAPRDAVPAGRLDLLMASPTCTFHSRARGGRPISRDQRYGRMTPTQVLRWVSELDVRCLLVENVPEFVEWGPVHETTPASQRCSSAGCREGRPCRARRGGYFRAWVRRLERLGYAVEWRVINAADFGDATTRKRFFLLARKDGLLIRWPEPTHSKDGDGDLFGAGRARWRPAREVIDWSIKGKSIFRRKKPLSPKTLQRIYSGALRFGWPEPFLVILRRHMSAQGLDAPLPTLTAGGTHVGLVQPLLLRSGMHKSNALCVRDLGDPAPTITTDGGLALVLPQHGGGVTRPVDRPLPTVTTDGAHALVAPYYGQSECGDTERPLPTITTRDRFGLVVPVTHAGSRSPRDLEQPLPTVTGAARGELAFITASFGEREGQEPRVHSLDDPVPTVLAQGRTNLVEPALDQGRVESPPAYDVLFRMLQPAELAAAMGFGPSYAFSGNKGEVTRQIGNAVPVRTAEALVGALMGVA